MSSTGLEIILVFLLILANGIFAMTEIALVSARKARLQQRAESGDKGAKAALSLVEAPNRFLSTVQIGITLVGILTGAVGGATLTQDVASLLNRIPIIALHSQGIALVIVVLLITYFSLVLGELIPKRLALGNAEKISMAMARPVKILSRLASPVVRILSVSTELGLRLIGIKPSQDPPITDEEIKVLMEQGTQVGIFEEAEQDIVESVFRLSDRRVDAIMTPRTEILWLDLDEPFEKNLQEIMQSTHTIFPVAQGNLDNVQGILLSKDLLSAVRQGGDIDLRKLIRPPVFVPESTPALSVLNTIKQQVVHVALVIDEYGGLLGMVTLFDILASIIGAITEPGQSVEPQAVHRPDGSWAIDGLMKVDEFKELMNLDELPDQERVGYQTLGGLVMSQLGTIPSPGQYFDWNGLRFEVLTMAGRRVDEVLVSQVPVNAEENSSFDTNKANAKTGQN
jgi:putative hemolysin